MTWLLVGATSTIVAVAPSSPSDAAPSPFVVEIAGWRSEDPLDRRLAELVSASLAGSGPWTVGSEDRASWREAEADLAMLASEDPARAMLLLRGRTSDFRIDLGVQGSVSEAEEVYGIATYAAAFEVSMTLTRSIDGSLVATSLGVGRARRSDLSAASDAAVSEATAAACEPVVSALRKAAADLSLGIDVIRLGGMSDAEIARWQSGLPGSSRVERIEGGIRIEPPLDDQAVELAAATSGWIVIDRSAGVVVLGERSSRTEAVWLDRAAGLAVGLGLAGVGFALWRVARHLRRGATR